MSKLTKTKVNLKVVKSDGTAITSKPGNKKVKDYLETNTPSLYMRDKFDKMFE